MHVVQGKRPINIFGLPSWHDVLFVNGMKANLIRLSKIWDNDHNIQFSKILSEALDRIGKCVLEGMRSNNNCYLLTNQIVYDKANSFNFDIINWATKF